MIMIETVDAEETDWKYMGMDALIVENVLSLVALHILGHDQTLQISI